MRYLITGGSSGLGKGLVELITSNEDHHVTYTFNNTLPSIEIPRSEAWQVDFADDASYQAFLARLQQSQFDVLINNYHTGYIQKHTYKLKETELVESFRNNTARTIGITGELINQFRKQGKGVIVNILSEYVTGVPPKGLACYVAEKAYLKAFTEAWHNELSPKIACFAVSPRFMKTPFNKDLPSFVVDDIEQKGLVSEVEAVAAFIFKASLEPEKWSGQNLVI